MPLYLFYTMVQKHEKWPKTQIKGSCLNLIHFLDGKNNLGLGRRYSIICLAPSITRGAIWRSRK